MTACVTDLGVRVTALVQRAARQSPAACRSCQLPANALALPLHLLVLQNVHRIVKISPLSLYARCLCLYIMQPIHM
jgi:hypothetical protein